MSQFTLILPDSLHQQLESLADRKGVPLNDYLVSALASLTSYSIEASSDNRQDQEMSFNTLLDSLGEASIDACRQALRERENIEPEPGLSPETTGALRKRLGRAIV